MVFDAIREVNRALDVGETSQVVEIRQDLSAIGTVLGVMDDSPAQFLERRKQLGLTQAQLTPEAIEQLIAERAAARKSRDFKRADNIRAQLVEQGVLLKDGPSGTTWTIEAGKKA